MDVVVVTYPYEREFDGRREVEMRERWRVRNATLMHLRDLGFKPHVQVSETPPGHAANRRNGIHALQATTGSVLYFEDDTTPAHSLLDWIPKLEAQDSLVVLCNIRPKDHPRWVLDAVKNLQPIEPQFVPQVGHWGGAQALYIPPPLADAIRNDGEALRPSAKHGPFDTYIRRKAKSARAAVPNPVQHVSPPSLVRKREPRASVTFAHPTKET